MVIKYNGNLSLHLGKNIIQRKKKKAGMPSSGSLKDTTIGEMKGKYLCITCDRSESEGNIHYKFTML